MNLVQKVLASDVIMSAATLSVNLMLVSVQYLFFCGGRAANSRSAPGATHSSYATEYTNLSIYSYLS